MRPAPAKCKHPVVVELWHSGVLELKGKGAFAANFYNFARAFVAAVYDCMNKETRMTGTCNRMQQHNRAERACIALRALPRQTMGSFLGTSLSGVVAAYTTSCRNGPRRIMCHGGRRMMRDGEMYANASAYSGAAHGIKPVRPRLVRISFACVTVSMSSASSASERSPAARAQHGSARLACTPHVMAGPPKQCMHPQESTICYVFRKLQCTHADDVT